MARPKKSIKRKRFHTSLATSVLEEAQDVMDELKENGIKKDGMNELIEEGLWIVIQKYRKEAL